MGFLDKLKEKGRGVMTAAKPEDGVEAQPVEEVRRRLLGITGKGIRTAENGDEITVAWSAKVAGAGAGGGDYQYLYRAIRIGLDGDDREAEGICLKTTANAELDLGGGLSAAKASERGQHVGSETLHVLAWLGPHQTEGGADEEGYQFSWGNLREPVIDAVTGAGWTYKPKKL